jgi:hypothetical protein
LDQIKPVLSLALKVRGRRGKQKGGEGNKSEGGREGGGEKIEEVRRREKKDAGKVRT